MLCHKSQNRSSYLARFGYLGFNFHGLQPNRGVKTAGGALLDVLESAASTKPRAIQFSARTDAGVHASENYATFWFPNPFDHAHFLSNLSSEDLRGLSFLEVEKVGFNVHARANAQGKWYQYCIEDESENIDAADQTAWAVLPRLNVEDMQTAAEFLVGTHEFDSFRHKGCSASSTTKTIESIDIKVVYKGNRRQIQINVRGTGFLRRMVRIIVGTLAEVGAGFRHPTDMKSVLESRDRRNAGPSAPAGGLTLMHIDFVKP